MWWVVLLSSALAGPSVDLRLERPLVHRSAWQITSSDGQLSPQTAFWNVFAGTTVGLGGRRGTTWGLDLELGNRRVRWSRPSGAKELGATEVWGGGQVLWRRGLTGARADVAWPWAQAGLGWSFGTNGARAVDYLYKPFQGPAFHAELGLEMPGQRPTRPFIALRWSGHAAIYNYRVQASCSALDTCYGLEGNSSAWRLGLQLGLRLGQPPEPWEAPEMMDGVGPVEEGAASLEPPTEGGAPVESAPSTPPSSESEPPESTSPESAPTEAPPSAEVDDTEDASAEPG